MAKIYRYRVVYRYISKSSFQGATRGSAIVTAPDSATAKRKVRKTLMSRGAKGWSIDLSAIRT